MSFNAIPEKKIITKISESTIIDSEIWKLNIQLQLQSLSQGQNIIFFNTKYILF